jgi:hypothetical protein
MMLKESVNWRSSSQGVQSIRTTGSQNLLTSDGVGPQQQQTTTNQQ